ncbi:MAG: LCP family protein [Clostridia bacterium]|nr:LCP family protein [Clostridia bacterium]
MKHSFKNFLVVFLMSVVIFSVAAVFLVQFISNTLLSSAISDEGVSDPIITTPDEGVYEEVKNTLSYLILGLNEEGDADYILLTHIDRGAGTFMMTDLPANLRIELDGGYRKLGEAASSRDVDFVREKVYALTAVEIDYLFCVEADGFVDLVDRFGGFEFNVPQPMQQSDADRGIHIDLAAGSQHLDGGKALSVLRFDGYASDAVFARSQTFRALMLAMCRGVLNAENNLMKASEMLSEIFSDFTTDMTLSSANEYLDTLFSFKGYTLQEFTYPGRSEGDFYLPDTQKALETYKPYRA